MGQKGIFFLLEIHLAIEMIQTIGDHQVVCLKF